MPRCSKCGEKRRSQFSRNRSTSTGWSWWCRKCLHPPGYWKRYYETHRKERIASVTRSRQQTSGRVLEYLRTHPCVDCGEGDPVVLEFDHVRGKKIAAICTLMSRGWTWSRLGREIRKCDVRCANCHAKRTARVRKTYRWKNRSSD